MSPLIKITESETSERASESNIEQVPGVERKMVTTVVTTTKINLPDESGLYPTSLGEVGLDMHTVGHNGVDQNITLSGSVLGGQEIIRLSSNTGRGIILSTAGKRIQVDCLKAVRPLARQSESESEDVRIAMASNRSVLRHNSF